MNTPYFKRLLVPPVHSFFIFGPRSVGKSFWLREHFQEAPLFDLLETGVFLELSRDPGILEAKIGKRPRGSWVCIDEVQKVPSLLGEVHRLMESQGLCFALSGSSARRLKRGGADLLAGRALTKQMEGLTFQETGASFDLERILRWGSLPLVITRPEDAADILSAYVHTYIKEEIREEGLVRRVEPFLRFLEIAALLNGQQLNQENVAREARVPRSTVETYFSVLQDTLIGHFLPAFRPEVKVREQVHPKFYWFDSGVARGAAGLLYEPADALWLGRSLETFLFQELRVYNHTRSKNRPLYFYRTGSGVEIDFIIETRKRTMTSKTHLIAIEVKYSKRWKPGWEKPMKELASQGKIVVEKMIGVYCGKDSYHFDGVDVLPVSSFLKQLFEGKIF